MSYHDVLLINPPSRQREFYEHLGLGYLAACLRKQNIDVKILNMPHWMAPGPYRKLKSIPASWLGSVFHFRGAHYRPLVLFPASKGRALRRHMWR